MNARRWRRECHDQAARLRDRVACMSLDLSEIVACSACGETYAVKVPSVMRGFQLYSWWRAEQCPHCHRVAPVAVRGATSPRPAPSSHAH